MMKGYAPERMSSFNKLNTLDIDDLSPVHVASVLEITSDTELARLIIDSYSVDVEHMELFSLASVSAEFNLELTAILSVSNFVGPAAHKEWQENHSNASIAAQSYILQKLY